MEGIFIVPQFIDAEDKIWGPITVRQFVIMVVGGLFLFISYKLSDLSLFLFQAVLIIILVIVIAFFKINGQPFHIFALNFISSFKKPRIRVWKKEYIKVEHFRAKGEGQENQDQYPIRKSFLSSKKLSELSLVIDTGGVYKGEQDANTLNKTVYSN